MAIENIQPHMAARSDYPAKGQWIEHHDLLGKIIDACVRCPKCGTPRYVLPEFIDDTGEIKLAGVEAADRLAVMCNKCSWSGVIILVGWPLLMQGEQT